VMKSRKAWIGGWAFSAFLAAAPALAGLDVGDPAPPLSIAEWIKGSPVELSKDNKKIHVVEFWAVWCGPCKISIPNLTDYQHKYAKDVTIIGVTDPDIGANSLTAIKRFVKDQGSKMEYTVAVDTGKTTQSYMAAAGAIGIPHAFIVGRDGRIAWQGSPLDPAMDEVLGKMVAGAYDIETAKLEQEVNRRLDQVLAMAQERQWQKVWEGMLDILEIDPANDVAMEVMRRISVDEMKDGDKFRAWARGHIDAHRTNAKAMQQLASMLCSTTELTGRMPDLALAAAKAAYDASGQKSASAIATYALAIYQVGNLDRAIALQQDAVAVAQDGDRDAIRGVLDYYRNCKKLQETVK